MRLWLNYNDSEPELNAKHNDIRISFQNKYWAPLVRIRGTKQEFGYYNTRDYKMFRKFLLLDLFIKYVTKVQSLLKYITKKIE